MTEAFETAYKRLNSAQKEAVDTIEGPVMVIAGPGTGKTQILTLRIAQILKKTDTSPENILALTFTESGARAMRERLRSYIGTEAYRVHIHTFHGFSENLIREYPDSYTRVVGGRPANDIEKVEILEQILESEEIKLLRPIGNTSFYIPHILRSIGEMKKEYISPDNFAEIISTQEKELSETPKIHEKGAHKGKVRGEYQKKDKALSKNKELLFVYRAYEALLEEKRLYDFEDIILETVLALKTNEELLRDLQETYQYILADEHQDVNRSQNEILDILASFHDNPNLFVVGDEKQAIYRFQGASLENFLYFENKFPNTNTITLTKNYRSGQSILDSAHSLIDIGESPASELRVPLTAEVVQEDLVEKRTFSHQAVEDAWIVSRIKTLVEEGIPHNQIAVIVRTNREVEAVASSLRNSGVPANASAEGDILMHPITNSVLSLISVVVGHNYENGLFKVLHGTYWGIPRNDLLKVASAQNYGLPLSNIIGDEKKLSEIGVEKKKEMLNVFKVIESARKLNLTESPHRVLEYILNESGFLKEVLDTNSIEGSRVIRRLYDEIERMVLREGVVTLEGVVSNLDRLREHNLELKAPYIHSEEDAIQVMTAHKSKGLEFSHVLVPHLTDSLWGGRKRSEYFKIPLTRHIDSESFDSSDDERRLLYVAMTRAEEGLYLSSSDTNSEGREFVPSRLLEDINEKFVNKIETAEEEKNFNPVESLVSSTKDVFDKKLTRAILKERGLSATALNNYLREPWDYFYRNILRIPEIQETSMLFGTVLHNTLERVTKEHTKNKKLPSDNDIKVFFESELSRLPITKKEYSQLHERGFEAVLSYVSYISKVLPGKTKEEFSLRVVLPTGNKDFPEVLLTGKLDRLDFDKEGRVIRVVDYKSGKPKTRGQIEGKTKDSNGDYKRQLVFYALLLSLYDDEKYFCREGVISFIEPDSKGKIHEETFTITEEEIEELKSEILRVCNEIINGVFFNTPCGPDSRYADLASEFLS